MKHEGNFYTNPGAKYGGAFSFGTAHVRHAREGRWVKNDTPRTLN